MTNLETLQKLYAAASLAVEIGTPRMEMVVIDIQKEFGELSFDWFSGKVTLCLPGNYDFYPSNQRVARLKIWNRMGDVYFAEIEFLNGRAVVKMSDDSPAAGEIKKEIVEFVRG